MNLEADVKLLAGQEIWRILDQGTTEIGPIGPYYLVGPEAEYNQDLDRSLVFGRSEQRQLKKLLPGWQDY